MHNIGRISGEKLGMYKQDEDYKKNEYLCEGKWGDH